MNRSRSVKLTILGAVALLAAGGIAAQGPIPQDPAYHCFADARPWLGIPNFGDVLSNLPFLIVGVWGLLIIATGKAPGVLPRLKTAYLVFFGGVALVALGSGYYHWMPDSKTLVWDRLPMTIAFMAFFAIILGEHLTPVSATSSEAPLEEDGHMGAAGAIGAHWLWPLVGAGLLSVVYWVMTDDLRLYAIVQFVPILLIPLIFWFFPSAMGHISCFWGLIAFYLLAKVLEWGDAAIFGVLHGISGHSLKHLAAAAGTAFVLLASRNRHPAVKPTTSSSSSRSTV